MPLSLLTRRRLRNFRANRRGFWSLWIFLTLFVLSLGAELIANDRPLLVRYDGRFYVPFAVAYPEATFGGAFPTEADYRDPVVRRLIEAKGFLIMPPVPYRYDTMNYHLGRPAPAPPSRENWLGTDDQGRDLLARLVYGFRISVLFGLALTLLSSLIGVAAGAVQGYFGGWIDLLFQRFIEIWSGLPVLYLLIILASLVEPNFWWLLGLMLLFSWTSLVGVVRAEFLRARNFDYVRAARALGVRHALIMVRHVLPNAMVATFTFLPFILSDGGVPAADEHRSDRADIWIEACRDTPLDAAQERLGGCEVMLAREQQRHVDGHSGEDRLFDGGQAFSSSWNLDQEVAAAFGADEERLRGDDGARRVVGEQGRHLERDPAVHAVALLVSRSEEVRGPAQVVQRELEEQRFGRCPGTVFRADGGVVGGARLDGVIEDRRVRGQSGDRELVDVALQPPAVQEVACDVVEPEALAQPVETSGRVHGVTSGALGSPSPPLRARWRRGEPDP